MALTKSALELLFDRLHHQQQKYIPGILQDAIDEYRMLLSELDRDERRRVSYIRSMIEYCSSERWGLARNQLEPAEEEYYRYFFRKLTQSRMLKRSPVDLHSNSRSGVRKGSNASYSRKENTRPISETYARRKDAVARPFSEKILPTTKRTEIVTDLTDLKTEQKIAEKFEEIFKNEWADALDELEFLKIGDRNAITCLFKIVLDAYRVCLIEAETQIVKLEDAAYNILLEGAFYHGEKLRGHRSYLMAYRRDIAYVCLERLQETFRRRYLPEIIRSIGVYQNIRTHGAVFRYANQCVAICWAMAVFEPPIYVADDRDRPGVFNRELYNKYTRSGESVAFYVWPPLFINKNGKLLSKGKAQGQ